MKSRSDLDFKDMIRQFDIDPSAAGKTCEQHCKDVLQGDGLDMYLGGYTQQEIDLWPAECAATRARFESEHTKILQKYGQAQFTKILRDIDSTTIVVFHSLC